MAIQHTLAGGRAWGSSMERFRDVREDARTGLARRHI